MTPPRAKAETLKEWAAAQLSPPDLDLMKRSPVSVLAVRGYYLDSMGKSGQNDRGIYDDAIFVASPGSLVPFNANTDPSAWRPGIASLEAPQCVWYKPGYHGYGRSTGHNAFRQDSPVIVRRDGGEGNGRPLGGGRFTDSGGDPFWTNLHRGGAVTTASAGCQTIPESQWESFYWLLRHELARCGLSRFPYFLIQEPRALAG